VNVPVKLVALLPYSRGPVFKSRPELVSLSVLAGVTIITTPQVPAARHEDSFGVQLQSVALSVFTLCGSVTASRSDCITPVTKTSESASIAEPSGRLGAKDVRVVRHELIARFLVFIVNC